MPPIAPSASWPVLARVRSRVRRAARALVRPGPDLTAEVHRLAAEVRVLQARVHDLSGLVEPFHTRPGTLDEAIFREVVLENEYQLPDTFTPTDVVLDIGGHVGSFSAACLLRGAGRVVTFEAEPANFALASLNLSRFGARADVRRAAVWRSDGPACDVPFAASGDPANTGGGGVFAVNGTPVPAVPFDTVLDALLAATPNARLRLLKLDCEGSEYPILLTSRRLDRVTAVCGEYHALASVPPHAAVGGATRYGPEDLRRCLTAAGFRVSLRPNPRNPSVGEFAATRPG